MGKNEADGFMMMRKIWSFDRRRKLLVEFPSGAEVLARQAEPVRDGFARSSQCRRSFSFHCMQSIRIRARMEAGEYRRLVQLQFTSNRDCGAMSGAHVFLGNCCYARI